MAISGLAALTEGREYFGVYPLRGKILNVRDAPNNQIMNCAVLNDIKKILGLSVNSDYIKPCMKKQEYGLLGMVRL